MVSNRSPQNYYEDEEEREKMGAGRYIATRIPTLKPTRDRVQNPFKLMALLNTQQWLFFSVAFIAWYVRPRIDS